MSAQRTMPRGYGGWLGASNGPIRVRPRANTRQPVAKLWHTRDMDRRPHLRGILVTVGAWAAIFGALLILDRAFPHVSPLIGFVLAFVGVCLAVVVGAALAALHRPSALTAVIAGLAGVGSVTWGLAWAPSLASSALAVGAGALVISAGLGAAIGHRVSEARYVWPLVLVAVGADLWSVAAPSGLTRQAIVEGPPSHVTSVALLTVPIPGAGLEGVLGLGDVIFTALLLGLVHRCGLSMARALLGLAVGLLVCLAFLLIARLPTPALVFIGPAVAIALGRTVTPRPGEVGLGVVFVAALWSVGALL